MMLFWLWFFMITMLVFAGAAYLDDRAAKKRARQRAEFQDEFKNIWKPLGPIGKDRE